MDDRYLTAFLSLSRHKVCGRKLKPFSLRHRLVLTAIRSPLLPGAGTVIKPSDLIIAARICSIDDPFKATGGRSLGDLLRLVLYSIRPARFHSDLEDWRSYILDTAQHPFVEGKKGEPSKSRGVDWTLSVALSLIQSGFSEEEAWTMPEGRAMFYFICSAIKNGADVNIVSTQEQESLPAAREAVMKAIEKAKAEAAKAAGNKGKNR